MQHQVHSSINKLLQHQITLINNFFNYAQRNVQNLGKYESISQKYDDYENFFKNLIYILQLFFKMQFRVRPSSKKSNNDNSLVEFPSKTFLPESLSLRSLSGKIDHLQNSLSNIQQNFRKERDMSNSANIQLQKRLDKLEYKSFANEQDIRQLSEIRQIKPVRQNQGMGLQNDGYSKNQIILLKQVMIQQKQAQKENMKHQNSLIEQMSLRQMRMQQEMREMINQQRMQYEHRLNGQAQEIRQIDSLKQRKIQQQYDLMKGVIANAEKKIYEELQRKIRNESLIKQYIEENLGVLREQIMSEQKNMISTETKFIRQTKQSIESLFGIVNTNKKQLSEELTQTQKLSLSNLKRISVSVDILRQKMTEQFNQIIASQEEIQNQMAQFRNFVTTKLEQNRQIMLQFEENAFDKIDTHHSSEGESNRISRIDTDKFSHFEKQMNQWKSLTEQKNLNVFKEISNTLKSMKLEWRKQNDQLVSEISVLNQQLKTLKKSGPMEMKKNVQAIITIFNNQFDVLAQEFDTLTEMIALAKKENQKYFKDEFTRFHSDFLQEIKNLIAQKGKECNLYSQKIIGKSQQSNKIALGKQSKYISELFAQKVSSLESEISQISSAMKKFNLITNSQLEDYSLKLKNFNDNYKEYLEEQRKDDMKKRMQLEELMRKNANNLMDICYKKSQFLVDGLKKNIQMAQIKDKMQISQSLEAAKDDLNKNIQLNKQDFQKQIIQKVQKLTKERQASEEILHQAIDQSINTVKKSLIADLGTTKAETEEKLKQIVVEANKKELQSDQKLNDMKNTMLKMIRDQKRLTEEQNSKLKAQIEEQIKKMSSVEMQKNQLQQRKSQEIEDTLNRLSQKLDQQLKRIREQNQKNLLLLEDKQKVAIEKDEAHQAEEIKSMKELLSTEIQKIKKENEQKLINIENKQKQEGQITNKQVEEIRNKQKQIEKNIETIKLETETKNKKLEQEIKVLKEKADNKPKQDEGKKVGEDSLKSLKLELQKSIKELQIKIQQIQSKNDNEEQEEALNNLKKSVNKLEAMVFSEQAKNKAMFDRLQDDVHNLSQNVALITNEIRDG